MRVQIVLVKMLTSLYFIKKTRPKEVMKTKYSVILYLADGFASVSRHRADLLIRKEISWGLVLAQFPLQLMHQVMKPFGLADTMWPTQVELPSAKVRQQWTTTCDVKSSDTPMVF